MEETRDAGVLWLRQSIFAFSECEREMQPKENVEKKEEREECNRNAPLSLCFFLKWGTWRYSAVQTFKENAGVLPSRAIFQLSPLPLQGYGLMAHLIH